MLCFRDLLCTKSHLFNLLDRLLYQVSSMRLCFVCSVISRVYLSFMPVVLASAYEQAVCLDAPVWSHSNVLFETVFALFYALREVALLVECG